MTTGEPITCPLKMSKTQMEGEISATYQRMLQLSVWQGVVLV